MPHDKNKWIRKDGTNEYRLYSLGGCEETEFDLTEPLQVKLVSEYDYVGLDLCYEKPLFVFKIEKIGLFLLFEV